MLVETIEQTKMKAVIVAISSLFTVTIVARTRSREQAYNIVIYPGQRMTMFMGVVALLYQHFYQFVC